MLSFPLFTLSVQFHPRFRRMLALAVLATAVAVLAACSGQSADSITGVWRAVVLNKAGEEIEFKLEIKREGEQVTGALVNGDQRVVSTNGSFDGKVLWRTARRFQATISKRNSAP
jgi:hypothetical protein